MSETQCTNEKVILINVVNPKRLQSNPRTLFEIQRGPHFPLGIASIGLFLKEQCPQVSLWMLDDQLISHEEIANKIRDVRPNIVGISSMFNGYEKALSLARKAKQCGAKVVMGGVYASTMWREILINRGIGSKDYCVDLVVRGDGEESFYHYVAGNPLGEIDNIAYFENNTLKANEIKINPFYKLSFDTSLIDPEVYFKEYQRRFPGSRYINPFVLVSHKGCAWRAKPGGGCLFCSSYHERNSVRDPRAVWAEIDELISEYSVDYIWEAADDFLGNSRWFYEYYDESRKRRERPYFRIQSRVDHLTDENLIKKLAALKVGQVFVGLESNDERCLKLMKKGTVPEMNERAVQLLLKYDIPIDTYFILGCPGEDRKSLYRTVALAEKIINASAQNIIMPNLFIPLPNTVAFNMVLKETNKKYFGKDIIDWSEILVDWITLYCKISHKEIRKALVYLCQLVDNINAYSF
jgi:radical SAM superfamily enzyme YgiQ (UPF0313 family)